MAKPVVAQVLSIDVPQQGPCIGNQASFAILRPVITVETVDSISYISAVFEVEIAILETSRRFVKTSRFAFTELLLIERIRTPWNERFFKNIELLYSHNQGEIFEARPSRSPQDAFTVTTNRRIGGRVETTAAAPPVPSAAVNLTVS